MDKSYVTWLLGQSVAVVLLAAWVYSLTRMLKKASEANQDLQMRNEKLCCSLVEVMRSNSQERAVSQESTLKTVLDAFETALQNRLNA